MNAHVDQVDALLPCPFCGGEAIVAKWTKYDVVHYTANCKGCDATATDRDDPQAAIDAWNTRATWTPVQGGFALLAAECARHFNVEGWTPEHDDEHIDGELAAAASCYALPHRLRPAPVRISGCAPLQWPWKSIWWKPGKDRIRELVKAGSLIVAEIERLQRAAAKARGGAA